MSAFTSPPESNAMILRALKLPTVARHADEIARQAERDGWTFGHYLHHLVELEVYERRRGRIARHLKASDLPAEKTLATLTRTRLPTKVAAMLPTLCEGGFVERGDNLLAFGLPGRGKSHLVCAIGHELIQRGYRVFFTATYASFSACSPPSATSASRRSSPRSTPTTRWSSTTSGTCSRAARRWRSSSPSWPSATSDGA